MWHGAVGLQVVRGGLHFFQLFVRARKCSRILSHQQQSTGLQARISPLYQLASRALSPQLLRAGILRQEPHPLLAGHIKCSDSTFLPWAAGLLMQENNKEMVPLLLFLWQCKRRRWLKPDTLAPRTCPSLFQSLTLLSNKKALSPYQRPQGQGYNWMGQFSSLKPWFKGCVYVSTKT